MFLAIALVAMLSPDMCRHYFCSIAGRSQKHNVGRRFVGTDVCSDCYLHSRTLVQSWVLTRNVFFGVYRAGCGSGAAPNGSGNHRRVSVTPHVMKLFRFDSDFFLFECNLE